MTFTPSIDAHQKYIIYQYHITKSEPSFLRKPLVIELRAAEIASYNEILFCQPLVYVSLADRKALAIEFNDQRWDDYFAALALEIPSNVLPDSISAEEKAAHEENPDILLESLKPLADTEFPPALCTLGILYSQMTGSKTYLYEAFQYFERASKATVYYADYKFYELYQETSDINKTEKNDEIALEHLKRSAHHDCIFGLISLYGYYLEKRIFEEAFICIKRAADKGSTDSQYYTGRHYYEGTGVAQSTEMAIPYFQSASNQGMKDAHLMLARIYKNRKHYPLMFFYAQKAADAGDRTSHINLAHFYKEGIGTKADSQMHLKHLTIAADMGCPISQYNLAIAYISEEDCPKDIPKAISYLKRHIKNPERDPNNDMAFSFLSIFYWHGIGVESDNRKVIKYASQYLPKEKAKAESIKSIRDIKLNAIYSRSSTLANLKNLSKEDLILETKATFYYFRENLFQFKNSIYNQNAEINKIREIYDLLEDKIESSWELLSRDELDRFVYSFTWLIDRAFHFDFTPRAASIQEINESYSIAHLIPKKKAKKKGPQGKKSAVDSKPLLTQAIKIPPVPSTHHTEKPTETKPSTPSPQPTMIQPDPKITPKKQKTETAESVNAKIKNTLQELKRRETEMVTFYLNRYTGHYTKLIQALFLKEDMSLDDINKLVPHIAKTESGETRLNAKGGMHILKLGSYTCGGHKPHGGKTTVDRASLADLRQVLSAHYYTLSEQMKRT